MSGDASLEIILRSLRLHVILRDFAQAIAQAERENWGYRRFLHYLVQCEFAVRVSHKVKRLLDQSKIPPSSRSPRSKSTNWRRSRGGSCQPSCRGTSSGAATISCVSACRGAANRFTWAPSPRPGPAVSDEGSVRADLQARLRTPGGQNQIGAAAAPGPAHKFDVICCDDIGYVQHSAEEMEVLFTFLAERYQQTRTLALTSNIVFSEWDRIFKNPMTAMAAVDRLVHRSVILEFVRDKSYREEAAEQQHS